MALTIYWTDPLRNFTKPDNTAQIAEILIAGKFVNVSNIERRMLQKTLIERQKQAPDIAVFGSSRADRFSSMLFPGCILRNNSVNSGTLEDYVSLTNVYLRRGILPKTIILELDPWILNENQDIAIYTVLTSEYQSLAKKAAIDISVEDRIRFEWYRDKKYFNLFSPIFFQQSLRVLILGGKGPDLIEMEDSAAYLIQGGYAPDGSLSYSTIEVKSAQEVEQAAIQYATKKEISFMNNFRRLDPKREVVLERFVDYISSQGSRVVLFLVPFHPTAYKILISRPEYEIIETFDLIAV